MENNQDDVSEELKSLRSNFRRKERAWVSEKESLLRKLQFVQHHGSNLNDADIAFFTEQRSAIRLGAEQRLRKQIQTLNVRKKINSFSSFAENQLTLL